MSKRTKYQRVLDGYLRWIGTCGVFLRGKSLPQNDDAPDAYDCMKRWESEGIRPVSTSEPELLADYVQGKTLRDWHISEWKDGIRQDLFWAEEFLGTLGVDESNFPSIFGHAPDPYRLKRLNS